eukprot:gene1324-770_t
MCQDNSKKITIIIIESVGGSHFPDALTVTNELRHGYIYQYILSLSLPVFLSWTPIQLPDFLFPSNPIRDSFAMVSVSEVAAKVKQGSLFSPGAIDAAAKELFEALAGTSYCQDFTLEEAADHVEALLTAKATQRLGNDLEYFHVTGTSAFFIAAVEKRVANLRRLREFLSEHMGEAPEQALVVRGYLTADGKMAVVVANFQPLVKPQCGSTTLEELGGAGFLRADPAFRRLAQSLQDKRRESEAGGAVTFTTTTLAEKVDLLAAFTAAMEELPGSRVTDSSVFSFQNGLRVYTMTVKGAKKDDVARLASLVPLLPTTSYNTIAHMWEGGKLSCEEAVFISTAIVFSSYFTPPLNSSDYRYVANFTSHDAKASSRLQSLRQALSKELTSEHYIAGLVARYPSIAKKIYADFKQGTCEKRRAAILEEIKEKMRAAHLEVFDIALFSSFVRFVEKVKKHNFYKTDKVALAFRIEPDFMMQLGFPCNPLRRVPLHGPALARLPRALHRHRARWRADDPRSVFQENYNLAHTQLLKNKDIPEGGSKGTILVSPSYINQFSLKPCRRLFLQYVDALMDVILPGEPGVVDTLQQEEIIFTGPDENTAGTFPAAGALFSKARGYKSWKSFTTGKDPELGGIPHDVYGMTTLSVRAYLEKLYEKFNIDQTKLTKFQTGGPRGDLGGNEILLGKEKIIGMLTRLVKEHLSVKCFDKSKLSKDGFLVLVDEENVRLPDGTVYEDGYTLRDEFHFTKYADADVFVPCGGRPRSVTIDNVAQFIRVPDADGEGMLEGKYANLPPEMLKFKYISEGANLFMTQDARLALERCGVIIFKDATANKGGVTSSSLEVLAGLALSDEEHAKHMCVPPGKEQPAFYKKYVQEIVQRVLQNARNEFDAVWSNWERDTKQSRLLVADAISNRIVDVRAHILDSDLFGDKRLVKYILREYVPKTLLEVVPIEKVLERVPVNYQHAICAMWLASHYVYSTPIGSNEFDFFRYMDRVARTAAAAHVGVVLTFPLYHLLRSSVAFIEIHFISFIYFNFTFRNKIRESVRLGVATLSPFYLYLSTVCAPILFRDVVSVALSPIRAISIPNKYIRHCNIIYTSFFVVLVDRLYNVGGTP